MIIEEWEEDHSREKNGTCEDPKVRMGLTSSAVRMLPHDSEPNGRLARQAGVILFRAL